MKKNNKRVFLFIMCLCLSVSGLTFAFSGGGAARAAEQITKWYGGYDQYGRYYNYELSFTPIRGGGEYEVACVSSYEETGYDIKIPSAVNGIPVTAIADRAFSYHEEWKYYGDYEPIKVIFEGCYNLESVTIPESVNYIGEYAFYRCYNLREINIPKNLASIGRQAFYETQFCYDAARDNYGEDNYVFPVYVGLSGARWLAGLWGYEAEIAPPETGNIIVTVDADTAGIADEAFMLYSEYYDYQNECDVRGYSASVEYIEAEFAAGASPRVIGKNAFGGDIGYYEIDGEYESFRVFSGGTYNYMNTPGGEIVYIGNNVCKWAVGVKAAEYSFGESVVLELDADVTGIANGCFEEYCNGGISAFMPAGIEYIGARAYDAYGDLFADAPDGPLYLGNAVVGFKGEPDGIKRLALKPSTAVIASMAFYDIETGYARFGYVKMGWNIFSMGGGAFAAGQTVFAPDNYVKYYDDEFPGCNFISANYLIGDEFYIVSGELIRYYGDGGAEVMIPFGTDRIRVGAFTGGGGIGALLVPSAGGGIVSLRGSLGEDVEIGVIYVAFGQAADYKAAWRGYADVIRDAPEGYKAAVGRLVNGQFRNADGRIYDEDSGIVALTWNRFTITAVLKQSPAGAVQLFSDGYVAAVGGFYKVSLTGYFGDKSDITFTLDYTVTPPSVSVIGGPQSADPDNRVYLMPKITFSDAGGIKYAILKNLSGGAWNITSGIVLTGEKYPDGDYSVEVANGANVAAVVYFTLKNTPVLSYKMASGYVPIDGEAKINCENLYLKISNCPGAEIRNTEGYSLNTLAEDASVRYIANIADGKYTFTVKGDAGILATFVIVIDKNIPLPTIGISGVKGDGKAVNGNVKVKDVTGGEGGVLEKVTVYKDGEIYARFEGADVDKVKGMKFRENGHYLIAASGASGYSEVEFDIQKKLGGGLAAASAAVPVGAAGGVFLLGLRARKRRIV